jgi:hypothetical protein
MQGEPSGLAKISDSPAGLTVNGSLLMSDPAAQRAYDHLKMGSIKGLSIGYQAAPANTTYSDDGAVRTLKSIRLFEISLCAVPCSPGAVVQSVKSLAQVETVLRSYRPGAVTAADLDQLRSIDATLKELLRKDAACTCACDDCMAGDCAACSDMCEECDACEECMAARADDAAFADALTAAAADLKKLTPDLFVLFVHSQRVILGPMVICRIRIAIESEYLNHLRLLLCAGLSPKPVWTS